MIDDFERKRRERADVCSGCGWGLIEDDEKFACVNDRCGRHGEHVRVRRVSSEQRPVQLW